MVCVDSVPVGNNIYVTVYNGLDGSVDNTNTFRFSCLVRVDRTSMLSLPFTRIGPRREKNVFGVSDKGFSNQSPEQ